MAGIYIHVPFCKSKCIYCDFNSYPGKENLIPEYFDAVKKELMYFYQTSGGREIDTIFIGGGTPSYVDSSYIFELAEFMMNYLKVPSDAEFSIETNPGTLSRGKLLEYRLAGINRISLGLQAMQDNILKYLGRIHTAEEFFRSLELVKDAGFKNINVDLIFGIPGQTAKDWTETLQKIIEMGLQHISCYSLKIEEGTPLNKLIGEGISKPIDDEIDREMYYNAIETLSKHGYEHYEISNFALPGYECKHNKLYWTEKEYAGFGAGAHSFLNGCRSSNTNDIREYCRMVNETGNATVESSHIDRDEEMSEYMLLGLRLIKGVSFSEFRSKYEKDIHEVFGDKINSLVSRGLVQINDDNIRLTSLGLDFANQVFMEFV
jgi:oxygen-independent coproporphyrinogen III oxidase